MNIIQRGVAAAACCLAGVAAGVPGSAAANPGDLSTLPVDPNITTDSQAYSSSAPVLNPNGQNGISTVYSHRRGDRQITDTILVFPDNQAATSALTQPGVVDVANGKTMPVPVGAGGTATSGTSPDGSQALTVLTFTQGNAAAIIRFSGPKSDPAPMDVVTDYGRDQATSIVNWQTST